MFLKFIYLKKTFVGHIIQISHLCKHNMKNKNFCSSSVLFYLHQQTKYFRAKDQQRPCVFPWLVTVLFLFIWRYKRERHSTIINLLFQKKKYLFLFTSVCLCDCTTYVCRCPQRPEEALRSHEATVISKLVSHPNWNECWGTNYDSLDESSKCS